MRITKLLPILIGLVILAAPITATVEYKWWGKIYQAENTTVDFLEVKKDDEGYITVGRLFQNFSHHMILTKLTKNGSVEWCKKYTLDGIPKVITTNDGYLLFGITERGVAGSKPYIIKLSKDGEIIWETYYGDTLEPYRMYLGGVIKDGDGIFALYKYSNFTNSKIILAKISYGGEVIWQKEIVSNEGISLSYLGKTPDGKYILLGLKYGDSVGVVVLDKNLDVIWSKMYEVDKSFYRGILPLNNGNMVIAFNNTLVLINSKGNVVKSINLDGWEYYGGVTDGKKIYYVTRRTLNSSNTINLISLDSSLNVKWAKSYEFSEEWWITSMFQDFGPGLVCTRIINNPTNYSNPYTEESMILKLSEDGNIKFDNNYASMKNITVGNFATKNVNTKNINIKIKNANLNWSSNNMNISVENVEISVKTIAYPEIYTPPPYSTDWTLILIVTSSAIIAAVAIVAILTARKK